MTERLFFSSGEVELINYIYIYIYRCNRFILFSSYSRSIGVLIGIRKDIPSSLISTTFLMLNNFLFNLNWVIINLLIIVFIFLITVLLICKTPMLNLLILLYNDMMILLSHTVDITIYLKFPGLMTILV